tara:strand:- start:715 stop:1233 length:519 start_codon:yes stop_codon:yes gene_type:complete
MVEQVNKELIVIDTTKTVKNEILSEILNINQAHVPMVGSLENTKDLANLVKMSSLLALTKENDEITSFIVCLREGTEYRSYNYFYFSGKYKKFLYIDRIAVKQQYQNKGLGSLLYQKIDEISNELGLTICAEVNTKPYNETSIQFHIKHGFEKIGKKSLSKDHEVAYFVKKG